jgi:hypothetical protein
VGRDGALLETGFTLTCFNPRAPRGARLLNCNSFDFCVLASELRELIKKVKQRTSGK